jgi:UDP-N-acetylglucosamine acyltransferase
MTIHASSIISNEAEIASGVTIGPFCVVRGKVKIGEGTVLDSHVSVGSEFGSVEIGKNNRLSAGSAVGGPPQDIGYKNESTKLVIGDHNIIREMVTINIGTAKGGGVTQIGDHCMIMAYTHVAHDCRLGNHIVIANSTQLAGHVLIEDHAKIGGMCGINQFVRIGRHSFVAGDSAVNKDILPFTIAQGNYAVMRSCNRIGMERSGIVKPEVESVNRAVRILTQAALTLDQAIERIQKECEPSASLQVFLEAIKASTRGIAI